MNAPAAWNARDPIERGGRLGPYEIVGPLGAGGMGLVVRAFDPRLGRPVAIKVLYADAAKEERRLRHFIAEARAASALNHPNILTVYEIGSSDRGPYLVTELVEGETLRTVASKGPVGLPLALDVVQQALAGLSKAHEAGIVHRDLKPENLMIRRDGLVKILDFGLAKLGAPGAGWGSRALRALNIGGTEAGLVLGTPAYMSPEQVRGHAVGAPSDVFSLALVLYELVAGRHPFSRSGPTLTMKAIERDEVEPIADCPPTLEAILTRGLAKNASQRYADAGEMLVDVQALRRSLDPAPGGAAVFSPAAFRRRSQEPRRGVRRLGFAAAGIVLALSTRGLASRAVPAGDPQARQLCVKGRYSWSRATEESLRTATEYFDQAIVRDPRNAPAWAGLADSELLLGTFGGFPATATAPRAEQAALKAIALDPDLADAHVAMGSVRFWYDWNWRGAETEFRHAIELNSSHPGAHHRLGLLLLALGRFDDARAELSRAAELDPVSLMVAADRGLPDLFQRRYRAAIDQFRSAVALDPAFVPARVDLAMALVLDGNLTEAEAEFRRANEIDREEPEAIFVRAFAASVRGDRKTSLATLAGLGTVARRHGVYPFRAALLYAFLGERDEAFRWLERGYSERSPDMVYLKTHPLAQSLRGDPRFGDLLDRIGLSESRNNSAGASPGRSSCLVAGEGFTAGLRPAFATAPAAYAACGRANLRAALLRVAPGGSNPAT